MYGCETWTIKKDEPWRIDAFVLWCWRRLLRVPWTARRSNQSILKEINPEYSLEGLMLKLKLQYFGHLMGRTDSLEKTLMLGKIEGRRRRRWQRRWLDGVTDSMDRAWVSSGSWWRMGRPGVLQSMDLQESDTTERLNWTELTRLSLKLLLLWKGIKDTVGDNGSPYRKVNRVDFLNQNTYRRDGRLPGKREQPGLGFSDTSPIMCSWSSQWLPSFGSMSLWTISLVS